MPLNMIERPISHVIITKNICMYMLQLSPKEKKKTHISSEELSLRKIFVKDLTGSIRVSLWRDMAEQHLMLVDIIEKTNLQVSEYNDVKYTGSVRDNLQHKSICVFIQILAKPSMTQTSNLFIMFTWLKINL